MNSNDTKIDDKNIFFEQNLLPFSFTFHVPVENMNEPAKMNFTTMSNSYTYKHHNCYSYTIATISRWRLFFSFFSNVKVATNAIRSATGNLQLIYISIAIEEKKSKKKKFANKKKIRFPSQRD